MLMVLSSYKVIARVHSCSVRIGLIGLYVVYVWEKFANFIEFYFIWTYGTMCTSSSRSPDAFKSACFWQTIVTFFSDFSLLYGIFTRSILFAVLKYHQQKLFLRIRPMHTTRTLISFHNQLWRQRMRINCEAMTAFVNSWNGHMMIRLLR